MSLDYNTRSFAPLANFAEVIFPLLSQGAHPVIYQSVIPAMGQTGTSAGNHLRLLASRFKKIYMCRAECVLMTVM